MVNPKQLSFFDLDEMRPKETETKKKSRTTKQIKPATKKASLATPVSPPPPEEGAPEVASGDPGGPVQKSETPTENRSEASLERAKKNQEAREVSLRYYERKKIALGKEKKNYSKLIFIEGNGKKRWYKAFGHSAIIFERRVAPLIDSKIKIRKDEDYNKTINSKEGVIAYQNINALKRKIENIGGSLEDDRDEIYIFNLPFRITEEEYNLYLRENELAIERANKILAPHIIAASLYAKLLLMHRLIFHMVGRMSGSAREMIGLDLERGVRSLIRIYLKMAKRGEDIMGGFKGMLSGIDDVSADLASIVSLGVDDDRKILEAAEKLEEVRKEVLNQMKIERAREIEKENGEILK